MDLSWPALLCPSSSSVDILDSAGRFSSPLTGITRTVSRPGSRLRLTMQFRNMKTDKRAALHYILGRLRGSDRVWVRDHSYTQRGSFSAPELLTNNTFDDGTTGWTAGGGATLVATDRVMRLVRASATDPFASQNLSGLTNGAAYVARVVTGFGSLLENNVGVSLNIGSLTTSFGTAGALRTTSQVSTGTTGVFYIDQSSPATAAGSFWEANFASLSRCALVDGASQALSGGLNIKNLPVSTNGLLLQGDQVQLGEQLLIVTAPVNSTSGGLALLHTAPALRVSPANNAPVISNQPMSKFMLESNENGWSNALGSFSDSEIVLVEAA